MHKDLLRLVRGERAVRRHLALCLAAAVLAGLLVLVQAELLAGVLSGRLETPALALLAVVVGVRGLLGLAQGIAAGRTTTAVKSVLRHRLLSRLRDLGPARLTSHRSGELVTLTGRGLDALDPYLNGYLPAVAVAGVVPVAVLARLVFADLPSAVIVLVTLPLIPVFGALVGMHTKAVTERQWRALSRLGGHFLDVVRGLPTLRAFGRARYQAEVIRRVTDAHRSATMRTLRVAFLSSLVLELAASLSLALVAVPIGLRLLGGTLDLPAALLVLLLAPEAYLPLRNMGTRFHAAMEGVTAADDVFAVLDGEPEPRSAEPRSTVSRSAEPPSADGGALDPAGPAAAPEIRLENVTVRYPGRTEAALEDVSLVIAPGERVALVGESGAGKSTLLHLLLGFLTPESGRVLVDGVELSGPASGPAAAASGAEGAGDAGTEGAGETRDGGDAGSAETRVARDAGDAGISEDAGARWEAWRGRLAFVPQRPHLFAASVADNIRLGSPGATLQQVRAAAGAAHADGFVTELPEGYDTVLGERGANLSAGQRQRIALARAFCRPAADLLLLDEPTARLDGRSEAAIVAATRELAEGRTAVIVAHRPAMIDLAGRVVRIAGGRVVSDSGSPGAPAARGEAAPPGGTTGPGGTAPPDTTGPDGAAASDDTTASSDAGASGDTVATGAGGTR
ncbi:ATP-binding cassette domain-containing protein [Planomonospora sp. ID91781]|uniref:ABC transporter ATP-binding protein/permease n=1 Tax=Planomonospora sp. ID91781 TaxID=2738135 RepID=UPI0018C416A8|nr:ATP-binding cassette domain-containing protein [Planomonospora sp. ID91781]MBG0822322.1 ATP-binding cassette domain-containing protein [Planomonospora sp. ID91781]